MSPRPAQTHCVQGRSKDSLPDKGSPALKQVLPFENSYVLQGWLYSLLERGSLAKEQELPLIGQGWPFALPEKGSLAKKARATIEW